MPAFESSRGENYGLIGPNGVGKTTLLRIIAGQVEADKGTLLRKKDLRVGYLPQKQEVDDSDRISEFLFKDVLGLAKEMTRLEELMSTARGEELKGLLILYRKTSETFEKAGGYTAEERGVNFLRRLGLDNSPNQKMGTLSGGEKSLVYFARAMMGDPELLILDEPGNHLDYLGLAWLESFLGGYPGTAIIVTHNRYLLDKTCGHLISMNRGRVATFTGSYTNYQLRVLRKAAIERGQYEAGKKRIGELAKREKQLQNIAMSQYNPPARIMSQLGAVKRKLAEEAAKLPEKPVIPGQSISLNMGGEFSQSKVAIRIKNFRLTVGDNCLLEDANMEIFCGQRVALVGPNGSGKSSLIKALLNRGDWYDDNLKIGPSQKIGYLSQSPGIFGKRETIEDEIRSWGALSKDGAFKIARRFSFTYNDMSKSLKVLSGGELGRLQLAKLMYQETNLLVLDEPTNHMDIYSREAIEEALMGFEGTILVVSHDRFFLDNLVDRVIEINQKKLISHEGNFTEYFKRRYPVLPRLGGSLDRRGAERKPSAEPDPTAELTSLENRIARGEEEKKELERKMTRAFEQNDTVGARKIGIKLDKLIPLLDDLYRQWERMVE